MKVALKKTSTVQFSFTMICIPLADTSWDMRKPFLALEIYGRKLSRHRYEEERHRTRNSFWNGFDNRALKRQLLNFALIDRVE